MMRHKLEENIYIKLKVRVLNRVAVVEFDIPPEVFFGEKRRLEDVIDDFVDQFVAESAMEAMPVEGHG